jgi:peptidoglycan/LPS O-acetylase OafA/YrhL
VPRSIGERYTHVDILVFVKEKCAVCVWLFYSEFVGNFLFFVLSGYVVVSLFNDELS